MVLTASVEQRGAPPDACFLLVSATVEQQPRHLFVALLACTVQWGGSTLCRLLRVRAMVEQQPRHLEMTIFACEVQRGAPNAAVRRPVADSALLLIALHCIGVGAVVKKP